MEIKSLRLHNGSQPLGDLFQISGKIRSVIVISAYIDLESINQLIAFVRNFADERGYPSLRVFIDKSSSRFLSDRKIQKQFLEAEKKIRADCDPRSGIFLVQLGTLFHSKAYLIEGNTKAKILFGSLNLTQKGINTNEELVLFEDMNIGGKANANRLAQWVKDYAEKLQEKSIKVGSDLQGQFPSCMRQLLLNGAIYYQLKEQNPFRFKLYLPEEMANRQADVDELLEVIIADSVSLEALIKTNRPVGMGVKLPGLGSTKANWKKFCVETCYGFWNPDYLRDDLKEILERRTKERKPHFDKIREVLYKREGEILACFLSLCLRIQDYLKSIDIKNWKYSEEVVAEEAWNKWIESTKNKIENDELYERLVSGISHVPSPDVWSDPLSSEEFEDSFCESIIYHWSKEYSRETNNVIGQALTLNLGLESEEKEKIDIKQLKGLIDQWLIKNPGLNIISFNEE